VELINLKKEKQKMVEDVQNNLFKMENFIKIAHQLHPLMEKMNKKNGVILIH
jgi:hypothetical protein